MVINLAKILQIRENEEFQSKLIPMVQRELLKNSTLLDKERFITDFQEAMNG